VIRGVENGDERAIDEQLRPTRLDEVIGQRAVVERLAVLVDAARKHGEGLQHILFDGPPGLGKTTLATVLPKELGVDLVVANGAALNSPKEIMPYLTNLTEHSVLFVDEIHRLPRAVEEFIYPAMEDYQIHIVLGEGLGARTLTIPLKKFTLIGATTRAGLLSSPLRERFVVREHLEFYDDEELTQIVRINARKLRLTIDHAATVELARRSRGTPRIANSNLRWVRNYAISKADGEVTLAVATEALAMQEIDPHGLDRQDRRYLDTLVRVFSGGPAGVEAIAATMNLPVDTLTEDIEPFLLRREFIVRTSRGRRALPKAFEHLGLLPADGSPGQPTLF
jgi:Holliday junction DNA helicase RuvB